MPFNLDGVYLSKGLISRPQYVFEPRDRLSLGHPHSPIFNNLQIKNDNDGNTSKWSN